MSDLVLSTKKSLYDPIEIEIDGKKYRSRPLSFGLIEELEKHEEAGKKGDIGALYSQVNVLYGIKKRVLRKLDIRDIQKLVSFMMKKVSQTTEKISRLDKEKVGTEKNELKPGDRS